MKCVLKIFFIFFLMLTLLLHGAEEFKCVQQWHHEDEPIAFELYSLVDKDNHLVGSFFKAPFRLISPGKIVKFAHLGQGPSDLMQALAVFLYKGDLAIFERSEKMKVFTKTNGTYVWKETKWFKVGKFPQIVKEGLYVDNKFFLAGFLPIAVIDKYKHSHEAAFVKIYDDNGQPIKQLIKRTFPSSNQFYIMRYHLAYDQKDRVFFLPANELKISVISVNTLQVVKEVNLEVPFFYKKMPKDFYQFKQYAAGKDFNLDFERWEMGYSSVTEMAVDGHYLVVQVRTCTPEKKIFALLFYNVEENFNLEKTIFTNDYLLDVKDGRYYFFANGNPSWDPNTDHCIINIYAFAGGK